MLDYFSATVDNVKLVMFHIQWTIEVIFAVHTAQNALLQNKTKQNKTKNETQSESSQLT
jgi:hypothetical protein